MSMLHGFVVNDKIGFNVQCSNEKKEPMREYCRRDAIEAGSRDYPSQ